MSSAGGRLSRSSPKRIGSVDPYALKIPAPKGRNTHYRWNATSPLHAEPEQPHVLSHHRSVFAIGQSIVIAMPRPRLGLFRQQLVQQFGHPVVDVLASVVGMKASNAKRKLFQHRFQHRQQPSLTDLLNRSYHLPLRYLIYSIEVIHAFTS